MTRKNLHPTLTLWGRPTSCCGGQLVSPPKHDQAYLPNAIARPGLLAVLAGLLMIPSTGPLLAQAQVATGAVSAVAVEPGRLAVGEVESGEVGSIEGSIPDGTAAKLADALRGLPEQLSVEELPNPEAAREELLAAIAELESFVKLDTANGEAWSNFIQLPELRELAQDAKPSRAKLAELKSNLYQNYDGLELGPFVRLRGAIDEYRNAVVYGAGGQRTLGFVENRQKALLDLLQKSDAQPSDQEMQYTNFLLKFLERSKQAPATIDAITSLYSFPNVEFEIHEDFVNQLAGRDVAQPRDVNECLLGTRIVGTACLTGDVTVDLQAMDGGIALGLNMQATMTSRNRGFNRGVVLHSTGTAPVYATKQIVATPNGISATPAVVNAQLFTRINAIEHKCRLVRKIANRKAAEQKPQADAIARGRLRRRVAEGYDEQVDEQLTEANSQLARLNGPMPVLSRLGMQRPVFSLASSDQSVYASVTQASATQLAAPAPCPIVIDSDFGMAIKVHQSLPTNIVETLLLDRVLKSSNLDNYVRQFSDEVPEDILKEADGPLWQVYFRDYQPVVLKFDDGRLSITLATTKLLGAKEVQKPAEVTAVYLPEFGDGTLTLRREGDLLIEIDDTGTAVTALKSVIRKKFESIFKDAIVLPVEKLQQRFPKTAGLELVSIDIDDGWMQILLR